MESRRFLHVMFPLVAVLSLLAGCGGPSQPLAELPVHELALSAPRQTPKPPADKLQKQNITQTAPADEDEWAAEGYRSWRYIVIHHSSTETGNAEEFDRMHRNRGWDELGYHFVIDNGQGGTDGRIEIGDRWKNQKWGAHTGNTPDNEFNNHGIGICLVGDFTSHMPTAAQLASLHRLVNYLVARYSILPENIVGHCDVPNANTECPGKAFHAYVLTILRRDLQTRYSGGPLRLEPQIAPTPASKGTGAFCFQVQRIVDSVVAMPGHS